MQQFLSRNYESLCRFVPPGLHAPILIVSTLLWAYIGCLDIFFNGAGLYTVASSQHSIHSFLGQTNYWRPLTSYINRLLYAAFGLDPLPYHVLDIALHSLNALLIYYIARKLSKDGVVALAAGLMFAAFYRHSGLMFSGGLFYELAHSTFCLLAIMSFRYFQDTNKTGYLAATLAGIFIALVLKDSAVVAFPIILVLDRFYRPHPLSRIRWGLILCLIGTGVVYLVLRAHFLPSPAGGTHELLHTTFDKLGWHESFKQIEKGLFVSISNVCPGRDLSYIFYAGFILFIWKNTEHKRIAATTARLVIISVIPLVFSYGIANRNLYLSTALSVMFLAVVLRYSVSALAPRILRSYGDSSVGVVTGAVLLLIVSLNVHKIHVYEAQYRDASNLFRTHLDDIVTTFPDGTSGYNLCLINTPLDLPRKRGGVQVWEGGKIKYMLSLFYGNPGSVVDVKQFTTDLGYPMSRHQDKISLRISNDELDRISKDSKNRVMVFNPYTEHMEDMTGKTSQEVRTALANTRG
ncbi:MAG: hypothetical protein ACYSTQ_01225 [Planctomycetota bacterium]